MTLSLGMLVAAQAQQASTLSIEGEVASPLKLTVAELLSMDRMTHTVKDRDNQEHTFSGIPLIKLLEKAGAATGPALRGKNMSLFILAQAADGYEVVYALPEVDPGFSDRLVLVAIEKDGQALLKGEGAFRLIATGDKKQARWVRELQTIKVLFAKP